MCICAHNCHSLKTTGGVVNEFCELNMSSIDLISNSIIDQWMGKKLAIMLDMKCIYHKIRTLEGEMFFIPFNTSLTLSQGNILMVLA